MSRVYCWLGKLSTGKLSLGRIAHFLSLTMSTLFVANAHAICQDGIHKDVLSELGLIHQISIIGEKDNRELYDEYATNRNMTVKEVHEKFSATGTFYCAGYEGTANVVLRNNLIVLTAHQFYKEGTCTPELGGDFSSCYFETIGPNGSRGKQYKIKPSTLKLGTNCPGPTTSSVDWAIVELEENVKGVKPYSVVNVKQIATAKDDYEALIGLKTTTVVARNSNFKNYPVRTPSICDGAIGGVQPKNVDSQARTYFLATGCSSGEGNSGGALLLQQESGTPALIGILTGSTSSKYDHRPFGPTNFTKHALIEGRFYDTLMGM